MRCSICLVLLLLLCALPATVQAQTLSLSRGTLSVSGGAVFDLSVGTITVGPGALLDETDGHALGHTFTATVLLDRPNAVNVGGLGATITSSANLGETTVSRRHEPQTDGMTEGIARYYDITPTNNVGLNATLVFEYRDTELNGNMEADLLLYRSDDGGTTWTEEGGIVNTTDHTITLGGIERFSRWTAASAQAPLPVELMHFGAVAEENAVLLQWKTASETNNAGFEVEHRQGDTFVRVAYVEGRGTRVEAQSYHVRIGDLSPGRHVFRLKQIDYDGTHTYSPEVETMVAMPSSFVLEPAYPNPFTTETTVRFAVRELRPVEVVLYDALGRPVGLLYRGTPEEGDMQQLRVEAGALPSGLYFLRFSGEGISAVERLLLVK